MEEQDKSEDNLVDGENHTITTKNSTSRKKRPTGEEDKQEENVVQEKEHHTIIPTKKNTSRKKKITEEEANAKKEADIEKARIKAKKKEATDAEKAKKKEAADAEKATKKEAKETSKTRKLKVQNKTQTKKDKPNNVTKKNPKPIKEKDIDILFENSTDTADVSEEMKNDEVTPYPEKEYRTKIQSAIDTDVENQEDIKNDFDKKEKEEYDNYQDLDLRYPRQVDPNFNIKIYEKKEFHDLLRKDDTKEKANDFEKSVEDECKSDFQILPHQQFVKNFMSIDTPYNSLLLYHELGTGKTCSAIGVAEETRAYMTRSGISRKTFIVGNNNILSNFRLQLFNPAKLEDKEGKKIWTLDTCVGESLLSEMNEQQTQGKTREEITVEINALIDKYYEFVGYRKLANIIESKIGNDIDLENLNDTNHNDLTSKRNDKVIRAVRKQFNNTLFIIDEAHNILQRDESKRKRAAIMLEKIAKYCDNVRFILLTATPMYNTHQEIIWMVNLMNLNDKRPKIKTSQVFKSNGDFIPEKKNDKGIIIEEGGKQLLKRKLIGYVSYVRGENPFTFPFRVYPSSIPLNEHTIQRLDQKPTHMMTGVLIEKQMEHLDLFVTKPDNYQKKIYSMILKKTVEIKRKIPKFEESSSSFAIQWMLPLVSTLNMTYPVIEFTKELDSSEPDAFLLSLTHGTEGLDNTMNRKVTEYENKSQKLKYSYVQFSYKKETIAEHKRIFKQPNISKYSKKISKICECVKNSTGIVLIYSNYLDFGLIPMCLALEEMGMKRYCKSDYMPSNMLTLPDGETFPKTNLGKYIMITGSYRYSPSNKEEIQLAVSDKNSSGKYVKVVLISGSGAEGIDLKNVRQVHIMEPWYNMNRIEQVIGRAVRNRSHCILAFEERNVEIYMHTSYIDEKETADMYLYRIAELKAIAIGKISRLLKECAVDCLLNNTPQQNYTKEHLSTTIQLKLSTNHNKKIDFEIGDKPSTSICDYMESCSYTCTPYSDTTQQEQVLKYNTYGVTHLRSNHHRIIKRIRQLFRDNIFYEEDDLKNEINIGVPYSDQEIYHTLYHMNKNKQIWLIHDGRIGYLINSGSTFAFQPNDMNDIQASIYERKKQVDIRPTINYNIPIDDTDLNLLTETENVIPKTSNKHQTKNKHFIYDDDEDDDDEDDDDEDDDDEDDDVDVDKDKDKDKDIAILNETSIVPKYTSLIEECLAILKITLEPVQKTKKLQKEYDSKIPLQYKEFTSFPLAFEVLTKHHGITKKQLTIYTVLKFYDELPFSQKFLFVKTLFTNPYQLYEPNLSQIELSEIPSTSIILKIIKSHLQSKIYIPKDGNTEMPHILLAKGNENIHFILTKKGWISAEDDITEKEKPYVQKWLQTFEKSKLLIERVNHDYPNLNMIGESTSNMCLIGFTGLKTGLQDAFVFKIKDILQERNNKGLQCFHKKNTMNYLNYICKITNTPIIYNNDLCKKFYPTIPIEQYHLSTITEHLLRHLQYTTEQLWYIDYECINTTKFLDVSISITQLNGRKEIKIKRNVEN